MDPLVDTLVTFATLLSELVVLFLGVSFVVTLLTRWVGLDRVGEWMGGGLFVSAGKGMALGFATPFCTYSAIPVLVGLRQAGVRVAAAVGFLLAAPVLDPLLFAAFAVLFSPSMALIYSGVTLGGVLGVAVGADAAGLDEFRALEAMSTAEKEASGSTDSCGVNRMTAEADSAECGPTAEQAWTGWRAEAKDARREAVRLTRSMAWHIVGAVALAALVMGYLPEDLLLNAVGPDRWFAIPAAALVGVPFYVSVEALAPVGAALASKGMSVGAVFALTIAGAGVNVPEFALLTKIITRRGIVALVGAVFAVAVGGGYVVQLL